MTLSPRTDRLTRNPFGPQFSNRVCVLYWGIWALGMSVANHICYSNTAWICGLPFCHLIFPSNVRYLQVIFFLTLFL